MNDRNAYNEAFGYSTADAGKKALLDSFWNSKQPVADETTLFGSILQNAPIDSKLKTTPEYQKALSRANNVRKFSSYSISQLATAIKEGILVQ